MHTTTTTNNNDSEYEEESSYVVLDLGSAIGIERIPYVKHFHLIGMEENRPVLQLGNFVFQGQVDETVGTDLIFHGADKKDNDNDNDDDDFRLVGTTTKKIVFKRVALIPRHSAPQDQPDASIDTAMDSSLGIPMESPIDAHSRV